MRPLRRRHHRRPLGRIGVLASDANTPGRDVRPLPDRGRFSRSAGSSERGPYRAFTELRTRCRGPRRGRAPGPRGHPTRQSVRPVRSAQHGLRVIRQPARRKLQGARLQDILGEGGPYALIQATASMASPRTREREVGSLVAAMEATGIEEGTIVTLREEERLETEAGPIDVVPAWKWFLRQQFRSTSCFRRR